MNESSKVLVTGGAGFIGSHLADELTSQGCSVVVLDNLSTGRSSNIQHLLKCDNFRFVEGSVNDSPLLERLCAGVEYIFHQAAIPSVPRSLTDPLASHEANVTGTLKVLAAARKAGVKKVIVASSSSVYGDTPTLPKVESMTPNPRSPYASGKLAAEYYCSNFSESLALPTVCLRYFNVYGPRQNPDSQYAPVIPIFITRILRGLPPVIYGDGEQSRDFTFVRDVVSANLMAAESDQTGVFNIGRGERVTLNQLAQLLLTKLEAHRLQPVYQQERPGDVKHSLADISRARSLGYKPAFSLEDGLSETISSLKQSAG